MLDQIIKIFKDKLSSNLGKDIGYTLISQLVIMILALLINKLLSNMLGVEGYGQYSIIKRSTSVLSFVMLGGMGIALPRFLATYNSQKDDKRTKSTVISSILIVLILSLLVIAACILMKDFFRNVIVGTHDSQLYFSAVFYASSLTFCSLLYAYYRGIGLFVRFSGSQISIQVIVSICVVLFGKDLLLVLNTWAISMFSYVIISFLLEKSRNQLYTDNPVNWKLNIFPQIKILFSYGVPRLFGDFFLFSFAAFPLIFISQKMNIESSSFFAVGLTLVSIVIPLFSFLGMVLLPYISSSIAQNNFPQANKLVGQLMILYIILSMCSILFLWLGINIFIPLFFSDEFIPASGISKILVATILSESIYLLLRNPIDAVSNTPYNTFNLMISFIVLIVLFYFSKTLEHYAASYLIASILKACLSFFAWQRCRNKLLRMKSL